MCVWKWSAEAEQDKRTRQKEQTLWLKKNGQRRAT